MALCDDTWAQCQSFFMFPLVDYLSLSIVKVSLLQFLTSVEALICQKTVITKIWKPGLRSIFIVYRNLGTSTSLEASLLNL